MSLHWSEGEDTPDNTAWQDEAVSAWQNFGEAAPELADDTSLTEHEPDLVSAFLRAEGLTLDTADPNQLLDACEKADEWTARAHTALAIQQADEEAAVSHAEEQAAANVLNEFLEKHGTDAGEAGPYIHLAMDALENGTADGVDDAMRQASEALGKWQGETTAAAREQHFAAQGYEGGVKSALSNFMREQHGPRINHTPNVKPVPKSNTRQGLGSVDAAKANMDNAVSNFAAQQRAKADLTKLARARVRDGG